MGFEEHYKKKETVDSYDARRMKGLKAGTFRQLERDSVLELMPRRNLKILEIGLGTGFITEVLTGCGKVTGVDTSDEMLKIIKAKFPDVKTQKGDILNLKQKGFDVAVTIRVISHFEKEDATRALISCGKSVRKGGSVIFNIENPSMIRRVLRKIINWGSTPNYQFSARALREMLGKAGLRVDKIFYLDHSFVLPLHLLNKIFFNKLSGRIFNLEKRLSGIRFSSNNSFVRAKKNG